MIAQSVADILSHHVKLSVEGSTGCTSTSMCPSYSMNKELCGFSASIVDCPCHRLR
jgi:hypothetical protein